MIRDRTVAALARYAAVAAEHDVRIGFEFHGYARCSVNTLCDAVTILDELDDKRVGLIVDAFHFFVGGSAFEDLERLDPARLLIAHLADVDHADRDQLGKSNRVMPGDGVLPLSRFVGAISTSGYRGPYSLELFRPEYWAMDPVVVATRGLESMRRVV
jgi:2-keto-myo-inositol isomerase